MQKSSLKYRRAKIKGQIMQFSQFSLFIVFNIVLLLLSCCCFFFLQTWFWWPRAKTEMTWIILINIYILKYNMRKMFFSQWHERHEGKNLSTCKRCMTFWVQMLCHRATWDSWELRPLDCSQSPMFSWDRLDIPLLTVTAIVPRGRASGIITSSQTTPAPPPK